MASAEALRVAIVAAAAGDEIVLAPGTYTVSGTIPCAAAGTSPLPIVVRAATAGTALIHFDALEGNERYDTRDRATANPATKIDGVGGCHWIIRGGTATQFCKDSDCTTEHQDGTLRNNAIVAFLLSASLDGPCNGRPATLRLSEGQRE